MTISPESAAAAATETGSICYPTKRRASYHPAKHVLVASSHAILVTYLVMGCAITCAIVTCCKGGSVEQAAVDAGEGGNDRHWMMMGSRSRSATAEVRSGSSSPLQMISRATEIREACFCAKLCSLLLAFAASKSQWSADENERLISGRQPFSALSTLNP